MTPPPPRGGEGITCPKSPRPKGGEAEFFSGSNGVVDPVGYLRVSPGHLRTAMFSDRSSCGLGAPSRILQGRGVCGGGLVGWGTTETQTPLK